jgi:hypothetical protein
MMRSGSVDTEGGIRAGGKFFCSMRFLASIDHDGRRCLRKHTTISQHARQQVSIVKTRKSYH